MMEKKFNPTRTKCFPNQRQTQTEMEEFSMYQMKYNLYFRIWELIFSGLENVYPTPPPKKLVFREMLK